MEVKTITYHRLLKLHHALHKCNGYDNFYVSAYPAAWNKSQLIQYLIGIMDTLKTTYPVELYHPAKYVFALPEYRDVVYYLLSKAISPASQTFPEWIKD